MILSQQVPVEYVLNSCSLHSGLVAVAGAFFLFAHLLVCQALLLLSLIVIFGIFYILAIGNRNHMLKAKINAYGGLRGDLRHILFLDGQDTVPTACTISPDSTGLSLAVYPPVLEDPDGANL